MPKLPRCAKPTLAAQHPAEANVALLVEWIRSAYPDRLDTMADQPAVFLDAPDAAMHLFLEELRAAHGSVEAYVASIGVDHEVVVALRANLLEP